MSENDKLTPKKNVRRRGQHPTQEERIELQDKFLKAFASNGNVRVACASAGISRTSIYAWIEHDADFSMRYNMAQKDVDDAIRAEIYRRAMFGEERYVVAQGKIVYAPDGKTPLTFKEKSDTLLIFHAKSRMPEYRDKQQVELTGKDGGAIKIDTTDYSKFTDEELAVLERLAQKVHDGNS
jgi:hypothetical protein